MMPIFDRIKSDFQFQNAISLRIEIPLFLAEISSVKKFTIHVDLGVIIVDWCNIVKWQFAV